MRRDPPSQWFAAEIPCNGKVGASVTQPEIQAKENMNEFGSNRMHDFYLLEQREIND